MSLIWRRLNIKNRTFQLIFTYHSLFWKWKFFKNLEIFAAFRGAFFKKLPKYGKIRISRNFRSTFFIIYMTDRIIIKVLIVNKGKVIITVFVEFSV